MSAPRKKSASTGSSASRPGSPYRISIAQKFPPYHGVTLTLHDKPPTPSEGGGGWESVELPRRGDVLVWKHRPLMKLTLSVVFDDFADGGSVVDGTMTKLLALWRPADPNGTTEPSVLALRAQGDVLTPYGEALAWVISNLEWGDAQGNHRGERTQQIIVLEFTEWRADERLTTAAKAKIRTTRHKVKPGETLAKIAKEHGLTAKELGAMQKPPIRDSRHIVGRTIIVPVGRVKRGA